MIFSIDHNLRSTRQLLKSGYQEVLSIPAGLHASVTSMRASLSGDEGMRCLVGEVPATVEGYHVFSKATEEFVHVA